MSIEIVYQTNIDYNYSKIIKNLKKKLIKVQKKTFNIIKKIKKNNKIFKIPWGKIYLNKNNYFYKNNKKDYKKY